MTSGSAPAPGVAEGPRAEPPLQGSLGGHRVLQRVGQDSLGTTYEVAHEGHQRHALAHVLRPELARAPQLAPRLKAAVSALRKVSHPGLVQVTTCDQRADGVLFALMERLEGESLQQRLDRLRLLEEGLPTAAALRIARPLAEVLAVLHEQGVSHGALRPEHIHLDAAPGEQVRLLALGIAVERALAGQTFPRSEGSLCYRAPEQLPEVPAWPSPAARRREARQGGSSSSEPGERADVYALGVVLYELLSGQPPFTAADPVLLKKQHRFQPVPRLPVQVPAQLAALCLSMLAKEPRQRPTMTEVLERMDALAALAAIAPAAPPPKKARAAVLRRTPARRRAPVLRRAPAPRPAAAPSAPPAPEPAPPPEAAHEPAAPPTPPPQTPPPARSRRLVAALVAAGAVAGLAGLASHLGLF